MSRLLMSPCASSVEAMDLCPLHHRLKKVQGKKKRDAEAAEATRKALMGSGSGPAVDEGSKVPDAVEDFGNEDGEHRSTDLLSGKDEDVIF